MLLEAARRAPALRRFVQISTDEVYGSVPTGASRETDELKPRNPYAASKAGADRLAYSYWATYDLPVIITRASNNYGPYQFPEKVIPLFVTNAIDDIPVPLYGDGRNVRDWLHVDDHCRAIDLLIDRGDRRRGLQHRRRQRGHERRPDAPDPRGARQAAVADQAGRRSAGPRPPLLPRHTKLRGARLGAAGAVRGRACATTVDWYRRNEWWWRPIKEHDPAFRPYYEAQYDTSGMTAARDGPVLVTGAAGFAGGHLVEHLAGSARRSSAGADRRRAPELAGLAEWQPSICSTATACGRAIASSGHRAIFHCAGAAAGRRVVARHGEAAGRQRARDGTPPRRGPPCGTRLPCARDRSAAVYAPSDRPIAEDAPLAPGSPYALSKLAQEQLRAAGVRRGRPRHRRDALVQPHRPAPGAGVRGAEHGASDRAHRARPGRAGDARRQPRGRSATSRTSATPCARTPRSMAPASQDGLQRRLGRRPQHPSRCWTPFGRVPRGRPCRNRPRAAAPDGNLRRWSATRPDFAPDTAGSPRSRSTRCSTTCWTTGGRKSIQR